MAANARLWTTRAWTLILATACSGSPSAPVEKEEPATLGDEQASALILDWLQTNGTGRRASGGEFPLSKYFEFTAASVTDKRVKDGAAEVIATVSATTKQHLGKDSAASYSMRCLTDNKTVEEKASLTGACSFDLELWDAGWRVKQLTRTGR